MNSPVWALLDPRLKLSVLFSGVFWGPSVTLTVFRWVRAQWELWLLCTLVKTSVWRSVNEHWKALKHETASALCVRAEQKRFTTVFTHPTAKWTHNNLQLIALVNFKQTLQFFLCGAMIHAFTLCQLEWNLNLWPLNSSVKVRVKVTIKACRWFQQQTTDNLGNQLNGLSEWKKYSKTSHLKRWIDFFINILFSA